MSQKKWLLLVRNCHARLPGSLYSIVFSVSVFSPCVIKFSLFTCFPTINIAFGVSTSVPDCSGSICSSIVLCLSQSPFCQPRFCPWLLLCPSQGLWPRIFYGKSLAFELIVYVFVVSAHTFLKKNKVQEEFLKPTTSFSLLDLTSFFHSCHLQERLEVRNFVCDGDCIDQ